MRFSVIVPLYNGAGFIKAALESVISQTYKDYEIVIVNDGSPDNSGRIVRDFISVHKGISFVYVCQPNKGLGAARNAAICSSRGDIMALLDQDDIWYPGKLEEVNRIFMGNPDIDIVCHSQNVRTNGKITHCFKPETIKDDVYRQMLFANKFSDNIFSTSAVAFKRDIIDKIGGFSEDRNNLHFVEDYDFWLRMAREGCKFYSLDKILGECSKHEKNFSRDLDTMLSGELRVLRAHYKDYKISHILDIYLMRRRIAIVYFRVYRKYLTGRRPVKGCLCLMKAVIQDPFFYTYFIKKLINRGKRSLP